LGVRVRNLLDYYEGKRGWRVFIGGKEGRLIKQFV